MRYACSRYKSEMRDLAYRIYLTDSLQAVGQGKYVKKRFAEMIRPTNSKAEQDPAAIANDILTRAGIEVIKTGERI